MATTTFKAYPKVKPFEGLAFRGASCYEPALEGLTRAYVTRQFMAEREKAGKGVKELVRASVERLDEREGEERKREYTKAHSVEVANYVYIMAREAQKNGRAEASGLDPQLAYAGGLIHDIGKTFLPPAIIDKELGVDFGIFTAFRNVPMLDMERRIIREEHISIGTRYVRLFGDGDHIRMMLDMVGLHHVMFNGQDNGAPSYPSMIKGALTPFHARMAKTADFVSAVKPRHYRTNGYISSIEGAIGYSIAVAGVEVDPLAASCLMSGLYEISLLKAKAMVERLAHPKGRAGVSDVHGSRVYAKEVVREDPEFKEMVGSRSAKKDATYRQELDDCARFYGLHPCELVGN